VPNDIHTASGREITFSIVAHLAASCWTYGTVHLVPVTERRKVKQMKDILIWRVYHTAAAILLRSAVHTWLQSNTLLKYQVVCVLVGLHYHFIRTCSRALARTHAKTHECCNICSPVCVRMYVCVCMYYVYVYVYIYIYIYIYIYWLAANQLTSQEGLCTME